MEFAIPFIALAGAYVISNQDTKTKQNTSHSQSARLKKWFKKNTKRRIYQYGCQK